MSVSYRNMQAFVCVADSATFAEAAEKLFLTQPALSSAIKKMEQQLGGQLFSRTTRRVQLTPEGETLLPQARRLLLEWDDAVEGVQNLFAMAQGRLSVAAMPSFAESRLPGILVRFHQQFPNIRLRIHDVIMEETIHAVRTGRADIGFCFEPELLDNLDFFPLFNDRFVAVMPQQHPLNGKRSIGWQDLVNEPFIMLNKGSSVRQWTEHTAARFGQLNIVAETGQYGSVGQLIAQGLGISVVPSLCLEQMLRKGLVCRDITDSPLVKRVGMVRASRGVTSVTAQTLWQQVVEVNTDKV
ncbi:LysR family transcriptional regulator [Alteromonas gilva]|uniref:LysR family transcriptional regulator n=1 Tax=Alteromonas gilva TaxID=2987522 RepID=A0ABT5L1T2_9ALTE|nr:LysR family transcriptional regulator [Alteromonas gilva]MDC8831004.1 LysR family transcriptional regulator [Alteromonas gilva]